MVLTSTIVGGELSLAPGVALAQKMGSAGTEAGGITAVFFGDGAACEGILHESVNLAVTWKLPLLYRLQENNQWQAFVPPRRDHAQRAGARVGARPMACLAFAVDGNDVDAVRRAALAAAEHVRTQGTPHFLELVTYRQRGHYEPDDRALRRLRRTGALEGARPDPHAARAPARRRRDRARRTRPPRAAGAWPTPSPRRTPSRLASPWPELREFTTDVYA